jgi:hypothetical protein
VDNADASLVSESAGDQAGACLVKAGDIDGDGYDDLAVGAPHSGLLEHEGGAVYLVDGGPRAWKPGMSIGEFSSVAGDERGHADLSSHPVGDLNGDGRPDLAISDG